MSVVTVVATAESSHYPPRVKLDVTDTGSSPEVFAATVMRLDPDGELRVVRTSNGNPLTLVTSGSVRVGTVYDYGAPFGAPVSYSTVESPGSSSAEVTIAESRVWLIHPNVPARSMPITVAGITARTRRVQQGVHRPMGSKYAVVQTDGQRKAPEYTLTVRTVTEIERQAIDTLLDDTSVLLLNVPADKHWGIGAEYVSIGDTEEDRLLQYAPEQRRHWSLPIIVVDAPVGGTQAARTYADLLDYSTYSALRAAYPTYAALLAGP